MGEERYAISAGRGVRRSADGVLRLGRDRRQHPVELAPLDGTPFVLRVSLNDWVRFTRPGDYRLVVTSRRLQRYSREPAPAVVSEPVVLRIEPATPEWAAAEAARAVADLESGTPERRRRGVAVLRHLGTREAALALARLGAAADGNTRLDVLAGLASSPYRADAVRAMEGPVDAGERIPAGWIRDLSILRSLAVPGAPGRDRYDEQRAFACEDTTRWLGAIGRREPSADELTTVLEARGPARPELRGEPRPPPREGPGDGPRRPSWRCRARPRRCSSATGGTRSGGPWIQPALEALYASWRGSSRVAGRRRPRATAARRARPFARPRPRHRGDPDRRARPRPGHASLPRRAPGAGARRGAAARATPRPRARTTEAAAMSLVARYGSTRLLPLVRGALDRGADCELEAAALAYLLEHDKAAAQRRLQPAFDRGHGGQCVSPPWWQLAPRRWDETVEAAALAHLGVSRRSPRDRGGPGPRDLRVRPGSRSPSSRASPRGATSGARGRPSSRPSPPARPPSTRRSSSRTRWRMRS